MHNNMVSLQKCTNTKIRQEEIQFSDMVKVIGFVVTGSCRRGWSGRSYRFKGMALNTSESPSKQKSSHSPISCMNSYRENEVLQERGVKLGPVGYRVPKVVLVHLDQMGRRYTVIY